MAEVKLTKNELRAQQVKLAQLEKYLPTLQLKKAMLQAQVNEVRIEIEQLEKKFDGAKERAAVFSSLFSESTGVDIEEAIQVEKVLKHYENIAGVDVPFYEGVTFASFTYSLLATSPWIDQAVILSRSMVEDQIQVEVAIEKKEALEKELREVSIRVNLFEKILIPRTISNIKKIRVFLGDQQLAAVGQAKVAKNKIEANRLKSQNSTDTEVLYAS